MKLPIKSTKDIYQIWKALDGITDRFPNVRKAILCLKIMKTNNDRKINNSQILKLNKFNKN